MMVGALIGIVWGHDWCGGNLAEPRLSHTAWRHLDCR